MSSEGPGDRAVAPDLEGEVLEQILDEARGVADRALARLRGLSNELPGGLVEQVARLHDDPTRERRKAARVDDPSVPVAVQVSGLRGEAAMKDHCPMGMAVLLPGPAVPGTLLRVRVPPELGGGGWVNVEVKYCRREGDGWVAGCELLDDQPPL